MTYIWQTDTWPSLSWNEKALAKIRTQTLKSHQNLLNLAGQLDLVDLSTVLIEESIETSAIEGDILNLDDVRSSVATHLGIEQKDSKTSKSIGIVDALVDVFNKRNQELSETLIFNWHSKIMSGTRSKNIIIGSYRTTTEPMRVISGGYGREKIHYQAPASEDLAGETSEFFKWFNENHKENVKEKEIFTNSAIAHFWFVTIHPFDDGNGRISRCLGDFSIAKSEKIGKKLFSVSKQINKHRSEYYDVLENTQKSNGDITNWLLWYYKIIDLAITDSINIIKRSVFSKKFYKHLSNYSLNERQLKVLKKLLEKFPEHFEGGLTNKKYVSIAKTSPESSKRDLKDLLEKNLLTKNPGAGRSTSYSLNFNI